MAYNDENGLIRGNLTSEDDGKCRYCNGTGKVEAEWNKNETTDCAACRGTGKG